MARCTFLNKKKKTPSLSALSQICFIFAIVDSLLVSLQESEDGVGDGKKHKTPTNDDHLMQ